jgi:TRAP-type C4-dicarboxylate transport system permease small subunit
MRKVELAFSIASGANLCVVFLVAFAQVIQRYVFKMSIPWATDVIRITFIYSVFCGMCVGVIRKSHLNIDVFVQLMPKKLRFLLALAANVIMIIFIGVVFRYGITFILANRDQTTPYLAFPMSWVYAVFPVAALVMLVSLVMDTCGLFFKRGPSPAAEGEK